MTVIFTFLLSSSSVLSKQARFDNYHVYSVPVENDEHHEHLTTLQHSSSDYSMWNGIRTGSSADIMVPPHKIAEFQEIADVLQLKPTLKVDNVQKLIDAERVTINNVIQPRAFGWTEYQTLTSIYEWLDSMLLTYPNILTSHVVGTSYENRTIRAVKLSYKSGNPTVFIEANIHAREWVTSASATWILNHLLTSTDIIVRDMAENIDWIIVPVLNVDGFEYTHTTVGYLYLNNVYRSGWNDVLLRSNAISDTSR